MAKGPWRWLHAIQELPGRPGRLQLGYKNRPQPAQDTHEPVPSSHEVLQPVGSHQRLRDCPHADAEVDSQWSGQQGLILGRPSQDQDQESDMLGMEGQVQGSQGDTG